MGVYYGMNGLWVPIGGQDGAADPNLLAENIKSGVTISGVTGTFTNDGTATASDILTGKTSYVNGGKVTGTMKNLSGGWSVQNLTPTYDASLSSIKLQHANSVQGYFPANTSISYYSSISNFGDATTSDVAYGKTFTSSAGLKVTGVGKLFEANYMGDTVTLDQRDINFLSLDFANNIMTIKPYNINSPTSRVTGVDNYSIRIRQSDSNYSETLVIKYTSTQGRYLHMEWSGTSNPSSSSATINYGERGFVTETWDDTNKQISLKIGSLEYYENTSYSIDIYITWEIMHI